MVCKSSYLTAIVGGAGAEQGKEIKSPVLLAFFITLKKSCRLRSFIATIMTFDYNYQGLLNLRPIANQKRILVSEGN